MDHGIFSFNGFHCVKMKLETRDKLQQENLAFYKITAHLRTLAVLRINNKISKPRIVHHEILGIRSENSELYHQSILHSVIYLSTDLSELVHRR